MKTDSNIAHQAKACVIVEIGNTWLKIAEVGASRKGAVIRKLLIEKHEGRPEPLSSIVRQAIDKLKPSNVPVVTYLPRQIVNIRLLELPSMDAAEIRDMVDLQVGKQTPYSRDEIVSDYKTVGTQREGYTRVILAIIQRTVLRQRFVALEDAGLQIENMSVSSEGVLNWYGAAGAMATARGGAADVVLDIDAGYTDLLVISDGQLLFTRSILVGTDQLMDDAAQWGDRFLQEIQRSLEVYRGEEPTAAVARIIVTGAGPHVAGLREKLKAGLDLPVEAVDALANTEMAAGPQAQEQLGLKRVSLTALVGMAYASERRGFNLVPDAVRVRRALVSKARSLTVLGMLCIAITVSLSLLATLKYYFLDRSLADLQAVIDTTEGPARDVAAMKEKIKVIKERLDARLSPANVLRELYTRVPESIFFRKIEYAYGAEAKSVILNGTADTRRDIGEFVYGLEDSPLFENVKNSTTGINAKDRSKFDFEVECGFETTKKAL